MPDWKRTTKEATLEGLRPELIAAIKNHVEKYSLGDILSDPLICIQTDSEKIKKGLFGGGRSFTPALKSRRAGCCGQ